MRRWHSGSRLARLMATTVLSQSVATGTTLIIHMTVRLTGIGVPVGFLAASSSASARGSTFMDRVSLDADSDFAAMDSVVSEAKVASVVTDSVASEARVASVVRMVFAAAILPPVAMDSEEAISEAAVAL